MGRSNILDSNVISTPESTNKALLKNSTIPPIQPKNLNPRIRQFELDKIPYREAVGSIMYLMLATRPDIFHSVSIASRYLNSFTIENWTRVKCILRNIKGEISYSLVLGDNNDKNNIIITEYCDADWTSCLKYRKLTSQFIFNLGSSCISCASRKQQTVALSTVEAEYMAAACAIQELLWLKSILKELNLEQD